MRYLNVVPTLLLAVFLSACGDSDLAATDSDELSSGEQPTGEELYGAHCQQCHEGTVAKAPPHSLLSIMSASSVFNAIENGVMRTQASQLSTEQRRLVAEYLTGQSIGASTGPLPRMCEENESPFDFSAQPDALGWGGDLGNGRHISAEVAKLSKKDIPDLELKWAFHYPDAVRARSQPATAGGAVFVGSQNGSVFSLDQKTGCVRWIYKTVAEVRTGIVIQRWGDGQGSDRPMAFFGDLIGNVHAVDAVTGALLWKDRPDDHPSLTLTAAPALRAGILYVPLSALEVTAAADPSYACCTFKGGVAAYNALSGDLLWTGYTITEPQQVVGKTTAGTDRIAPSGSPVWGTPSIDEQRGLIYVGTGENYSSPADGSSDAIIALSLDDGHVVWTRQMTINDAWNMACESENQANCPPEDGPDYVCRNYSHH